MCVNVSKDFGVYFRGESRMGEEELLLRQVFLIVHGGDAVFVRAGRVGGGSHAAPLPLAIRRPVGALQRLGGCGRSAGRGAVFPALTEPEQHSAEDQDYSCWDAHDDRPGQGVVGWREDGRDGTVRACGRVLFTINIHTAISRCLLKLSFLLLFICRLSPGRTVRKAERKL